MICRLSKESTDVCVCVNMYVKDDPKGRVYFIFSGRVPQQIGVTHMKTKTTGIPFTDYNVNTTGVLSLALILSPTFSQGVIKPQYSTRLGEELSSFRLHAPPNLWCFPTISTKKGNFVRFYNLARLNFYPIINFANHQKFPFERYTRDARDDQHRTRCPNRRELL